MKPHPQPEVLPEADDGPVLLRFPDPKTPHAPSSTPPSLPEPDLSREYSRSLVVVLLIGGMLLFGSWARHRNAPILADQSRSAPRPSAEPTLTPPDAAVFASPTADDPARLTRRSDKDKPAEDAPTWTPIHKPALTGHPIPVNRASADELLALPGIGPVLAKRIVEERDRKPFASVEDMRRVSGIGAKRIEQLRPLITVR